MRFVDGEQGDRGGRQELAESRLARAFRRNVQQVQPTFAIGLHRFAPVGVHAGQRGRADTVRAGRPQLVMHQRDERGDDHAGAFQREGRQLVGQRFARARGHDGESGMPVHDAGHDLFLPPAEIGKAEGFAQHFPDIARMP